MSLWRQLARGLRALTRRSTVEAELDDEVRDYFERARADLDRQSLTLDEAARAARRQLGDVARAKETLRSYGWENGVDAAAGDFRQSFRRLRQNPNFTTIVVLTLALGIGVNVALFSLFEQILLRPLPVTEPERLVNLSSPGPQPEALSFGSPAGGSESVFNYPMFRDLQRGQEAFAGIAAHRLFEASVSNGVQAQRVDGMFVSGNYFSVLGVQPALGRLIGPQDDRIEGQAESVVLSHAYWQNDLGGDPDVVGRRLFVSGTPLTIVGVAPRGFRGTTIGARASVFVPITFGGIGEFGSIPDHDNRDFYWVYLVARLEPGVGIEEAEAGIAPLYRSILNETEAPLLTGQDEDELAAFRSKRIVLEAGGRGQTSRAILTPARAVLQMLLAASGVVLLLCCANIAGLMLVRGSARSGEMALRASIGATRMRLASLLLTESLLLALPAALLSLPVALLILRAVASGVPGLPASAFDVSLSLPAALVGIGTAVVSALAFGLYPVRDLIRTEPAKTLQSSGIRQTSGTRVTRFRTGLSTAQIALSMALLVVTFVFAQSLANIARIDIGLDVDSVLTFSISPQASGYSPEASARLFERLREELAVIPGVTSVSDAAIALLGGGGLTTTAGVDGPEGEARVRTYLNSIDADFFGTLGIPLLAGRAFRDGDTAQQAVIVTQRFAEGLGAGRDVIGRRVTVPGADAEIVGLAADAKYVTVTGETAAQVFLPRPQASFGAGSATFYVRSAQAPEFLISAVRETVARVDPLVPITDLRTMRQQLGENLARERFVAGSAIASAMLATALAGLGLYGVLAYTVAQRAREIALRFALGAPAARIRLMVLRRLALMASVGIALGVVAALLLGRAAESLLFGVEAASPVALAGGALVLAAVTLGAAFVPLRRASRIEPMAVLRYE